MKDISSISKLQVGEKNWKEVLLIFLKKAIAAPADVAQSAAASYHTQKVGGLIPGQGTYIGCVFGLWLGQMRKATDQ